MWRRVVSVSCLMATCFWGGAGRGVEAGEPQEKLLRAEELVLRALQSEGKGELTERRQLLTEASHLVEDFAPALWHLGMIQDDDNRWRDIAESSRKQVENKQLEQYERNRAQLPDTVEGHWQLASWSAQNKLGQQCMAHLHRITQIDPNHVAARSALGHQLLADQWLTLEDQNIMLLRAQQAQLSFQKYGERVNRIFTKVLSGPPKITERALAELNSIRDPLAVTTIESFSMAQGEPIVELVVSWLASIDDPAASQALVRCALLHPSESIRSVATERLKDRPVYDYVPELLTMLSGPVQFTAVPNFDRRGNFLGYRQAFAKEGMNEVRLNLTDRGFQRVQADVSAIVDMDRFPGQEASAVNRRAAGRRPRDFLTMRSVQQQMDRMVNEMSVMVAANEVKTAQMNAARENEVIRNRNQQISNLLSKAVGAPTSANSQEIWQWWDDYNDTYYQSYKPQRYDYNSLEDRIPQYAPQRYECFVAGTPVMTGRGMRPIEQLAVGDLALSRDVATGRICWQPIIAATFQPPKETMTMVMGEEELTCTAGHLFWISVAGWKKAKEIEVGDWMHASQEPVQVTGVKASGVHPTFNLEVLEHHTYFVGKNLVLSHDVTPRKATRNLVPGYRPNIDSPTIAGSSISERGRLTAKFDR